MNDAQMLKIIARLSSIDLLGLIVSNPEYLSDSYYKSYANAITSRYRELRELNSG